MSRASLVFIKLGGSLITCKDQPNTARLDVICRLAEEISTARAQDPSLNLVIGHGSGSFGHAAAARNGLRGGITTGTQWGGFVDVWQAARALNQLVITHLYAAGLPVMAFPPSASVLNSGHTILQWDIAPLQAALSASIIPVIQGDTVFDQVMGGTILSTEDGFAYLASRLKPDRILLAGIEPGVWMDFPARTKIVKNITPATIGALRQNISGSQSVDVTGGMTSKVDQMLSIVKENPDILVEIFSGVEPGGITRALLGESCGTRITAR